MKKLLAILALPVFISTYTLADAPVCSPSERPWAANSQFFDTGIGSVDGTISTHFFDLETISIDKKNKVIKAWIIREDSEKGKSIYTREFNGFSNYGYEKMLWTVDYANMRLKNKPSSFMSCDGSTITTLPDNGKWTEIPPASLYDMVVKKIMEKYNLK